MPYVLFPSRRKLIIALSISAAVFLLAVAMAAHDVAQGTRGLSPRVGAVVTLSTSLYFIVTLSLRLLASRPILEADASGIILSGATGIEWNDLASIEVQNFPFRCLVFRLCDGSGHRRYYRLLPPYSERHEPVAVLTLAAERTEDVVAEILSRRMPNNCL